MSRVVLIAACAALVLGGGACAKKDSSDGLPPAQEWGADPGIAQPAAQGGPGNPANPHAGMGGAGAAGANPHAGMGLDPQGNPEGDDTGGMGGAGAAGAGAAGANPHAGLGLDPQGNPVAGGAGGAGGTDVSKLGLQSPDPNRAIDPAHHVKGVIKIDPKAAAHVQAGGAIFVIIKRADASGAPTGTPLAVDKLTWQQDALPFELGEAQAMIAGTELVGDVVVTARYDQDGDALSKQPGDVVGQLRVKIPADNVTLTLDQVLP